MTAGPLPTTGLSGFLVDLLVMSAPRPRFRVRDVVRIGSRWRRRRDGIVVIVRQVHRAERRAEVSYELAVDRLGFSASCWPLGFDVLTADYELLIDLEGAK